MATSFDSLKVHDLDVSGKFVLNGVPIGGDSDAPPDTSVDVRPVVPDSTATSVKQLVEDFNGLLEALRDANVIA